ncbi:MAG: hypothetical protein WCV58_01095 [Patescibacteria group bacterium]|jgi:hypothetical protein
MGSFAKLDFFMLPDKLKREPLPDWLEESVTFDQRHNNWDFDYNCEQSLVCYGISNRQCPTLSEWAAFVMAGSIIASLSGKYIIPVRPEHYDWGGNLECFVWEVLSESVLENFKTTKLNRSFLLAMLRDLFPSRHYCPPDRSYCESTFAKRWSDCFCGLAYPENMSRSVSCIRSTRFIDARKAFQALSKDVRKSILEVSQYTPTMLDIAVDHVCKTHSW